MHQGPGFVPRSSASARWSSGGGVHRGGSNPSAGTERSYDWSYERSLLMPPSRLRLSPCPYRETSIFNAGKAMWARGYAYRDPDGGAFEATCATPPFPGLHQYHREHDGHDPARVPQREALAQCRDGVAVDWRSDARGSQRVPATEGSQAVAGLASGIDRDPNPA